MYQKLCRIRNFGVVSVRKRKHLLVIRGLTGLQER